jgi:N-acetyl sugar amidotransferase
MRQVMDWEMRWEELKDLCDRHRRSDGGYDCIVPVSGGKDSTYQVWTMKERLGMNPLLLCLTDIFTTTKAGAHNLRNIQESFDCDLIRFSMAPRMFRAATQIGFERWAHPLKFIEDAIYVLPIKYAVHLKIPLIVYGEWGAVEYGESRDVDGDYSTDFKSKLDPNTVDKDRWFDYGFKRKHLNCITLPTKEEMEFLEPIWLGYYTNDWSYRNMEIAKRFGFRDLTNEWYIEGNIEQYDQIDSVAYIVHSWCKYPKFGFARATDIAVLWIREGRMTREEAVRLVNERDGILDQKTLEDFCDAMGYQSFREFWDLLDPFWNREIFERDGPLWRKKVPLE